MFYFPRRKTLVHIEVIISAMKLNVSQKSILIFLYEKKKEKKKGSFIWIDMYNHIKLL